MPQELTNLRVKEVSLVDAPACAETDPATGEKIPRARVALFKRDEELPISGTEQALARLRVTTKGEPMTLEQIEKALKDQEGAIATLKADNAKLAADGATLKSENEKLAEVAKMSAKQKDAFDKWGKDKQKEYMDGDADKRKSMMADCKEPDGDEAKKADAVLKGELLLRDQKIAKLDQDLAAITKARRIDHFTNLAERELPHTPGSPIQKGETLMQLAEAFGGEDSEKFKATFGTMKSADANLAPHFREFGLAAAGPALAADAALEKAAEVIAKRESITPEQAYLKACEQNPQLYKQYQQEFRSQHRG